MIGAVVFDLDGTLVDSTPDIAAALNHTLAKRGLGPLSEEVVFSLTGLGAEALVRRAFAVAGAPLDEAEGREQTARYLERYGRHPADRSELFEDAARALSALNARGLRVGVCTNKPTDLAWTVLRALGVDGCVAGVVGRDAAPRAKPDPAHLYATLEAIGATPEETVYVGDTTIDVRTAEAAGLRCAMVAWGAGPDATGPVWARLERFCDLVEMMD